MRGEGEITFRELLRAIEAGAGYDGLPGLSFRCRNFHSFALPRVIHDLCDARDRGARSIFLVDDNITLESNASPRSAARSSRRD